LWGGNSLGRGVCNYSLRGEELGATSGERICPYMKEMVNTSGGGICPYTEGIRNTSGGGN